MASSRSVGDSNASRLKTAEPVSASAGRAGMPGADWTHFVYARGPPKLPQVGSPSVSTRSRPFISPTRAVCRILLSGFGWASGTVAAKYFQRRHNLDALHFIAWQMLAGVLPHYVHFQVYQMILDSRASEHSARMVAMKNATDNAKQLIKDLTLEYNKVRQAAITTEILEIATAQIALG